jgi:hypothetical protein
MAQEVEHLPSKSEALSLNPITAKKKKKKKSCDYHLKYRMKCAYYSVILIRHETYSNRC